MTRKWLCVFVCVREVAAFKFSGVFIDKLRVDRGLQLWEHSLEQWESLKLSVQSQEKLCYKSERLSNSILNLNN